MSQLQFDQSVIIYSVYSEYWILHPNHNSLYIMKLLYPLLIFIFSTKSFASCPDQLWSNYKWADSPDMSEQIKSCIINSESFQESLKGLLCTETQDSISNEYVTYLDYKTRFEAKIEERDAAESEVLRRVLDSDARSIKNEWRAFGYQYEIQSELFLTFKADRDCFAENQN